MRIKMFFLMAFVLLAITPHAIGQNESRIPIETAWILFY